MVLTGFVIACAPAGSSDSRVTLEDPTILTFHPLNAARQAPGAQQRWALATGMLREIQRARIRVAPPREGLAIHNLRIHLHLMPEISIYSDHECTDKCHGPQSSLPFPVHKPSPGLPRHCLAALCDPVTRPSLRPSQRHP